jgi:WD40 repeat protein
MEQEEWRFQFSPDGTRVIVWDRTGLMRLYDASTGREQARVKACFNPIVSPDGKTLAFAAKEKSFGESAAGLVEKPFYETGEGPITLWDVEGGSVRARLGDEGERFVEFSDDGKSLASLRNGALVLSAADTGAERFSLRESKGRLVRDSLTGWQGAVELSPRESAQGRTDVVDVVDAFLSASFAPDGKTLAAVTESGKVQLWDAASGRKRVEVVTLESRPNVFGGLGEAKLWFSPGGRILVIEDRHEIANSVTTLWDMTMSPPRLIPTVKPLGSSLVRRDRIHFSADGTNMILDFGGATAELWDPSAMLKRATFEVEKPDFTIPGPGVLFGVRTSLAPDGATLAATNGMQVQVLALPEGREVQIRGGYDVAFSPDGKALAVDQSLAYSSDGKTLIADPKTVRGDILIYDLPLPPPVRPFSLAMALGVGFLIWPTFVAIALAITRLARFSRRADRTGDGISKPLT